MRFPVELKLRRSRLVKASVWVVHVAAALALFHVPAFQLWAGGAAERVVSAGAWMLLVASLVRGLRAQGGLEDCTVWLECDGLLELLREAEGVGGQYRVPPGSQVVLPMAVWFALVPVAGAVGRQQAARRRRVFLVPDNLPAGHFRLLRIWLRHHAGRHPRAEVAP